METADFNGNNDKTLAALRILSKRYGTKEMSETKSSLSGKIRILIADDHQMFIDSVKALFQNKVNGEEATHVAIDDNAYNILCKQNIDLLITDISMPGIPGTDLSAKIKQKFPKVNLLVVSTYNGPEIVSEIMVAEADGYILKTSGRPELLSAIYKLEDHGNYYKNEILSINFENEKITER